MASKKKTVKHQRLATFIQRLADEPAFVARFKKNPKACMDEHNLGSVQRKAVQTGQQAVSKLLSPGVAACMSLIAQEPGTGRKGKKP